MPVFTPVDGSKREADFGWAADKYNDEIRRYMQAEAPRSLADRGTEMRIADALERLVVAVDSIGERAFMPAPQVKAPPAPVGTILDTAYPELIVTWMRCDTEGTFIKSAREALPVFELDLSVRARIAIRKIEAQTIGDIARAGKLKLLKVRNCGMTTVREIERQLREHGLTLGT